MLNFFRKLGLTKRDFILIISLVVTLSAGLIIKWSGWKDNVNKFDYTVSDSLFETKLTSAFKQLELTPENKAKLKHLKSVTDSLMKQKDSTFDSNELLTIGKKVNINSSYAAELQLLPGIGKVMAERIVEYRDQNGGYNRIEELMNIKGIGQKKFERIKHLVTTDTAKIN